MTIAKPSELSNQTFFTREAIKKELYKTYQDNLSRQFVAGHQTDYTLTTEKRLTDKWKKSEQQFYAYASSIRTEVELDFKLLGKMLEDSGFAKLSPSVQRRVEFYYYDYAQLLLDDASLANHRAERDEYQKIINEYHDKKRKAATLAVEAITIEKKQRKTQQDKKKVQDTWLVMLQKWYASLLKGLSDFATFHPSVVIDWIGYFNMYRLMTVFCRLTWRQFWLIGRALGWLDQTGNLCGAYIDIAMMDAPTEIFNLLSVFLFLARFAVDFSMILKHVFLPTDAERGIEPMERFRIEWNKRYGRMCNDVAWVFFNGLTNYAIYFNIPIPIAGWLLAGFLVFDVWFLSYQLNEEEKVYTTKKQQLEVLLDQDGEGDEQEILYLQLKQLEYRRAEMRGKLAFYMAAATLFVVSFSLVLSVSSPWAAPICFLACVFAVAMYLSGGKFGAAIRARKERHMNDEEPVIASASLAGSYKESSKLLAKEMTEANDDEALRAKAERDAWISFGFALAENVVMPMLIVGLFTINWPAAIALTVIYIGIKHVDLKKLGAYIMSDESSLDEDEQDDDGVLISSSPSQG